MNFLLFVFFPYYFTLFCPLYYVQPEVKIFCTRYQKRSDTGTILNYCSCAHRQHKNCVIQGKVNRLFRGNSNWEAFHEAWQKIKKKLYRNHTPRHWVGKVVKGITNQLRLK